MRSSKFTIKKYTEGKKKGFVVSGYSNERNENGNRKRPRKKFSGKDAFERAQAHRHLLEVKEKQDKTDYEFRESRITDEDEHTIWGLVEEIRDQLDDHETPLKELVRKGLRFFIDSPVKGIETYSVSEARDLLVGQEKFLNRSKRHRDGFRRCLKHFCSAFGDRDIGTISNNEIEDWIYRNKGSRSHSKLNDYRFVHAFFQWCSKKAIVGRNVVTMVDKPTTETKEPISLSIQQARDLLYYAAEIDDMSMLPYFAVGIFAGVRPSEMIRGEWDDLDWDENIIRVRHRKGSIKYTRSVELPPICVEWLDYCKSREKTGSFTPQNYSKLFNLVRACAGFKLSKSQISSMHLFGKEKLVENCDAKNRPSWANDQMRHTAITYRLKIIKHIGEVAEWSGNTPRIIKSNYQSVKGITAQSTKEFYDLTPENVLSTR